MAVGSVTSEMALFAGVYGRLIAVSSVTSEMTLFAGV